MGIGSEFYRDLSKVENKWRGISYRWLKIIFSLILVMLVLTMEIFFLPDWLYGIVTFFTALPLAVYPVALAINKERYLKRKIALFFYVEEREYVVGQIRRYAKHEFVEKKEKEPNRKKNQKNSKKRQSKRTK